MPAMVWDLRGALLKKEEVESSRLADFEFRLRARTMRLLARRVDPALDPAALVGEIATGDDDAILSRLADRYPDAAVRTLHADIRAEARRQLIAEIGDPSPHRLA